MNLPPMPEPTLTHDRDLRPLLVGPTWNESAMRDYGAACYAAALEAAAERCEALIGREATTGRKVYVKDALTAIRAAMPPKP